MVLVYKCTSCGGELVLEEGKKQLVCGHCGNSIDMFKADTCEREVIENVNTRDKWLEDTVKLGCPSCGSRIYSEKNAITATCRYCSTQMVILEQIEDELCPDKFIAFRIGEEEVTNKIRAYVKAMDDDVDLSDGKLEGMYVPFWLYDFCGEADITGICRRDGAKYYARREGKIILNKVPLDASLKMPNKLIDDILPYKYEELYDFQRGALAGYSADKYDLRYDEMQKRLYEKVDAFTNDVLKDKMTQALQDLSVVHQYTSGTRYDFFSTYDKAEVKTYTARTYMSDVYYALLPVWYYTFTKDGVKYRFLVNGQTGRLATDFEMSAKKKAVETARNIRPIIGFIAYFGIIYLIAWWATLERNPYHQGPKEENGLIYMVVFTIVYVLGYVLIDWHKKKKAGREFEYNRVTSGYLDWDCFEVTEASDSKIR